MKSSTYKALQNAYMEEEGLQRGDVVKVNNNAGQVALGWKDSWDDELMGTGGILTFIRDSGDKGILLSDNRNYPFYTLDKLEGAKTAESGGYHIVEFNGDVYLNGNKISKQILDQVKQEIDEYDYE